MKSLFYVLGAGALAAAFHLLLRSRTKHEGETATALQPSYDDIARRAYFIGLDRKSRGEPVDSVLDWAQAEQQLSPDTPRRHFASFPG